MKCLVVCVDALDYRLVKEINLFAHLKGNRGVVWSQSARKGQGVSSAKAWACMYTGSTEEELKHLNLLQARIKGIKCNTVSDTGKQAIWAKLSDLGCKVGVLEGLVTDVRSLPKKKGNFILTGIDGPREWWPEDLNIILPVERLAYTLPYPVGYKTIIGRNIDWEEISEAELQAKMPDYYFGMPEFIKIRSSYLIPSILSLQEKYDLDFLLVYRYEIDHLSHMQWHEPSKTTVLRGYRYIEEFVLELKRLLNPDHIMIVSDHGMGELNHDPKTNKKINGLSVTRAADNESVIVSCEHEGPGFYLLTGTENLHVEKNLEELFNVILNIYQSQA